MARTDRRVVRTKKRLHEALTVLIADVAYEEIGVQDITQRADLSRATFYLHYRDKDALFVELVERLLNELTDWFGDSNSVSQALSIAPLQLLFQHVADHHRIYQILLNEQHQSGRLLVHAKLTEGFQSWMRHLDGVDVEQQIGMPPALVYGYAVNALLGMLGWWLSQDMPYSVDVMAEASRQLQMFGIMPVLMGATIRPNFGPISADGDAI